MVNNVKKVGLITLGCDKNRVDAEKILALFVENGYTAVQDIVDADVIVVNTCGFIDSAKKEAISAIFDALAIKEKTGAKVVVTGCLAERYGEALKEDIPEIDYIIPLAKNADILNILDKSAVSTDKRVLTTPPHYAYLKIADGCNNHCAFCAIPSIRGRYVSTPIEEVVDEAKRLINDFGVKEIILVAQDVTRYGYDLYGKYAIVDLLKELVVLDVVWIRLMYCYPELVSDELIDFIAKNDKVCKYLDIPMQHACDKILKSMRRRNTEDDARVLIDKIRSKIPNATIRSTFMVGFPGETDDDFDILDRFLRETRLDNVGFFAYSREEGTLSYSMKGQVATKVKKERLKKVFLTQQAIAFEKNADKIGNTYTVLYEGIDDKKQLFVGRSYEQAPDIDGKIYFTADFCPLVGEFYRVHITNSIGYDLYGETKGEER